MVTLAFDMFTSSMTSDLYELRPRLGLPLDAAAQSP